MPTISSPASRLPFALVFAWVFAAQLYSADVPPRWNVLFVFADDWGRYASIYARIDGKPSLNDIIKTPNIDQVAREGIAFRHAFVNCPSCTPCR